MVDKNQVMHFLYNAKYMIEGAALANTDNTGKGVPSDRTLEIWRLHNQIDKLYTEMRSEEELEKKARNMEERLNENQRRFNRGLITREEYDYRLKNLLAEARG